MAQNLYYGTYEAITSSDRDQSDDTVSEMFCYNNTSSNCATYGGYYQWAEAMALPSSCNDATGLSSCSVSATNYQGICPAGWHIPTANEWNTLFKTADPSSSMSSNIAGEVLKSSSSDTWQVPGTDTLGFTALGVGGVYYTLGFGDFGRFANIWGAGEGTAKAEYDASVTLSSGTCARMRGCTIGSTTYCTTDGDNSAAVGAACDKHDSSSVRCVQN